MKRQKKASQVPNEFGRKEDPEVSEGSDRELQSSQESVLEEWVGKGY